MLEDVYHLSPLQEGFYYHWLKDRHSHAYFSQMSFRVNGVLDIALLELSMSKLAERYAVLRTCFTNEYGEKPLQVVKRNVRPGFEFINIATDSEATIERFRQADRDKGFNLNTGSQMRLTVLQLDEGSYELIWSHHHILMDGWCLRKLVKEIFAIYFGLLNHAAIELKKAYPYSAYINWLSKRNRQDSLQYWRNYLADYDAITGIGELSASLSAGPVLTRKNDFNIDGSVYHALKKLCKETGVTENIFVQTIWAVLLSKYNNTSDVAFGAVVSGRPPELEGVEEMVGLFINTIPVRIRVDGAKTIKNLLKEVQLAAAAGADHHYMQLAEIQAATTPGASLFDHILVFENYPETEPWGQYAGKGDNNHSLQLSVSSLEVFEQTNYDFWITIVPGSDLRFRFFYNGSVFSEAQIDRLREHFIRLIEESVRYPDQDIHRLDLLSDAERHLLLEVFNNTSMAFASERTIAELFEEQVKKDAGAIAVVNGDVSMSFGAMNAWSNQLAHYLRDRYQVKADELVAIKLDRSEWMVAVIMGILKSGAAYVPVDTEYPASRVEYIRSHTECKVMIDEEELERFKQQQHDYSTANPVKINNARNLAYVIYTSGSTGQPKGCMLEHRGVVNRIEWMWKHYGFKPDDVILQKTPYTFDVSVWELLMPLCYGARMVICPRRQAGSPRDIMELISRQGITCLHFVPSMLGAFISYIKEAQKENTRQRMQTVRRVVTSGEALPLQMVKSWYEELEIPVHNLYGPTEASVDVSYYATSARDERIPIGRPIWNTQLYIINADGQLSPVGVSGELCIGGVGLARGYLKDEQQTRERFIQNPFKQGELLYRTGDRARWLASGEVEYLGRTDDQLKIRGYRVEPAEIEAVLKTHPRVKEAVVLGIKDETGEMALHGFITTDSADPEVLRTYLSTRLPSWMIPTELVQVEAIPLNSHGKTDRKQLQQLSGKTVKREQAYIAPRTATEQKLVAIWQEVLGRDEVSVKDNFFSIGGHSIRATRLAGRLQREFGVEVELSDLFTLPVLEDQARMLDKQSGNKYQPISQAEESSDGYVLSSSQRRLWVLSQLEEDNSAYNLSGAHIFEGMLDRTALESAVQHLIERHESLRTVFQVNGQGELRQHILPATKLNFSIAFNDLRTDPDRYTKLKQRINKSANKPFNLSLGPLLRIELHQLEDKKWILTHTLHHIISDAWSMEVLIKELLLAYDSTIKGKPFPLSPLRIQYKDYAVWQQRQLETLQESKQYWLRSFEGGIPVLNLGGDYPRPVVKTYNGDSVTRQLNAALSNSIKELISGHGCTLFMALLGGVKALLYRYTGQTDIVIGSSMASREHAELENQIGFYVNTLALRTRFNGADSYLQLLQNVKKVTTGAYAHQQYPFDELVEALNPERDRSRHPLFDVMVVLQNTGTTTPGPGLHQATVSHYGEIDQVANKFDLTFFFTDTGDDLVLRLVYNKDIFDSSTVSRMAVHLEGLLHAAISAPHERLGRLEYMSAEEKQQLLQTARSAVNYKQGETIPDLFKRQVDRSPATAAVTCAESQLSYEQLDRQSSWLSVRLQKDFGIGRGDIVGILLDRSVELIVSMMGILKSGAAYMVIEAENPRSRREYMLKNAGTKVLITQSAYLMELDYFEGGIIAIDIETGLWDNVKQPEVEAVAVSSGDLAYVVYTSGTTGDPKGVMITHGNVVDYYYGLEQQTEIVTSNQSFGFISGAGSDLGNTMIYAALLSGGRLQVFRTEEMLDKTKLSQVDCIKIVPSHWKALQSGGELSLPHKMVVFGGEALSPAIVEAIEKQNSDCIIYNHYGPTETTIGKLAGRVNKKKITLGRPFGNTQVYILDNENNLLPPGAAGEICIAGRGVGKGYINNAGETALRFINDPFNSSATLYRTGDLGRWTAGGELEYIGRKDDQLKIRGYRVEPGEIEAMLKSYEGIDAAVVTAWQHSPESDKELVAYLVKKESASTETTTAALRLYLRGRLPEYMLPAYYVWLPEMPLTSNGKIDRRRLPGKEAWSESRSGNYVAPRNETEEKLVKLWQEVLGREEIGVQDNFFDMGGHSLRATRLVSLIHKTFEVNIGLKEIFSTVVLEDQAALIQQARRAAFRPITKALPSATGYPLSSSQQLFWISCQFEEANKAYTTSRVFVFEGPVDRAALDYAFNTLIDRHEILRTIFNKDEQGNIRQFILPAQSSGFHIHYHHSGEWQNSQEQLRKLVQTHVSIPFNLATGPLLRAHIYPISAGKTLFSFAMHHIISDGWSMQILITELLQLYHAHASGMPNPLAPLDIQYKDYAAWQQQQLNDGSFSAHRSYWLSQFEGELPVLDLPFSKPRPVMKTYRGNALSKIISKTTTAGFKQLLAEQECTLFMGMLAALNTLLHKYTAQEDIIIGTSVSGREHADLAGQIGYYLNTLAIRTRFSAHHSFHDLLNLVKPNTIDAYHHQAYPFDELVNNLNYRRDTSRNNLFDILLVLQDGFATEQTQEDPGSFKINNYEGLVHQVSKFDLSFSVAEAGSELQLRIEYNSDLFDKASILAMADHFADLLSIIVSQPLTPIKDLPELSHGAFAETPVDMTMLFNSSISNEF